MGSRPAGQYSEGREPCGPGVAALVMPAMGFWVEDCSMMSCCFFPGDKESMGGHVRDDLSAVTALAGWSRS